VHDNQAVGKERAGQMNFFSNQAAKSASASTQRNVQVEIYGQKYVLKGEADESYINTLARFVDNKMHDVAAKADSSTLTKVAILAAINIAHELFQSGHQHRENIALINKRASDIIDSIECQFEDLKL
jgi:cell division protein ZapA